MSITFPNALTEEEERLKQAFARLKKKKKLLQALKTGVSQEKEVNPSRAATKHTAPASLDSAAKTTEQAKRLVQSGAIKLAGVKEKSGFKRSKTFTDRKQDTDRPAAGMSFQPFMSYNTAEEETEDKQPPNKRIKGLNESFVSAGFNNRNYDRPPVSVERDQREREPREQRGERDYREREPRERGERDYRDREPPKTGNTVYVHGVGVTEPMLQKAFSNFGKIININVLPDRNKAFITFRNTESADAAINEINGSMLNNIQIKVSMARNQPSFDALGDQSSTASWASIAASTSTKPPKETKRSVVAYDQDDMF